MVQKDFDVEINALVQKERERQKNTLSLIASENIVSKNIRAVVGSELTNKYAEGYPNKRYYGGCEYHDQVEILAVERAKQLFKADHVNVQPHSGSTANMAAFFSLVDLGSTILAMDLDHGGHLTHGSKVNFSGKFFNVVTYGVSRDTKLIDYDDVERRALQHQPKIIVAGASAYSRVIDFARFARIAKECGAFLLVDMAHIAGLVAASVHPSPVPFADIVTSTTHKTLRGSRGGLILCKAEYKNAVDKWVFPGLQGGPLMHEIAGKAVCFKEALDPSFVDYQKQVVENAKVLGGVLQTAKMSLLTGGTDNHLILIDLTTLNITGQEAEIRLGEIGIIANKNKIPFDEKSAALTSGIRLGTPSITTRGMMKDDVAQVGQIIVECLMGDKKPSLLAAEVQKLASRFIFE